MCQMTVGDKTGTTILSYLWDSQWGRHWPVPSQDDPGFPHLSQPLLLSPYRHSRYSSKTYWHDLQSAVDQHVTQFRLTYTRDTILPECNSHWSDYVNWRYICSSAFKQDSTLTTCSVSGNRAEVNVLVGLMLGWLKDDTKLFCFG